MFNQKQQELTDRAIATIGKYSDKQVSVEEYTNEGIVISPALVITGADLINLIEEFKEGSCGIVPSGLAIFS